MIKKSYLLLTAAVLINAVNFNTPYCMQQEQNNNQCAKDKDENQDINKDISNQINNSENNNQIEQEEINNKIIKAENSNQEKEEDNKQFNQNKYVIIYHKYLKKLSDDGIIDIDENWNIIENEKFLKLNRTKAIVKDKHSYELRIKNYENDITFRNIRLLPLLYKEKFIDTDEKGNIIPRNIMMSSVPQDPRIRYCYEEGLKCDKLWKCFNDFVDTKSENIYSMLDSCCILEILMFDDDTSFNNDTICCDFECDVYSLANSLGLPKSEEKFLLKDLKEKYPEIITITDDTTVKKQNDDTEKKEKEKYITVKQLETYLKNKIYILNMNYILSIFTTNSKDKNKVKQESINLLKKILSIKDFLTTFLINDLHVPKEDVKEYCDFPYSSTDELLAEFND